MSLPSYGYFAVSDLLDLLKPEFDTERKKYFEDRLKNINKDLEPELKSVLNMRLPEFDTFIEILNARFGKSKQNMLVKCLDSLMNKNLPTGLLAQSRTKGSPRRFVLGSKLLQVLLQVAVLTQDGGRFVTREVRVEELLALLRNRYGLHIDRLPEGMENNSILDRRALRLNLEAFKRRLREIGFYENLSDAYVTQKVSPRYTIEKNDKTDKNGRLA